MANKTFKESQPEGALKGSFFDKVPDAYQVSNYLKGNKKNKKKENKMAPRNTKLISGDKGKMLQDNDAAMRKKAVNSKSIPGKNKALMSKIAGGSKGTFSIPKSGPKTIPGKNAAKMSEISGNSPMGKGGQGSTTAMKPAPKKKNPVVTPKMLKNAGFPNTAGGLRDYMNFKSGKTRKGGGKAVRTEAFKKKNPAGMMGDSFKAGGSVKKMMGGGMTKGKMMKYRGGGMVSKSRPTKYI